MGLCLSACSLLIAFEFLTLTPGNPYGSIFIKLPFSVHKMLPFVTFVAMIMFSWKLMTQEEWSALEGMGRSPWQILRTPLLWVMLVGLLDVWMLVPLGQKFFNPFEGKKTEISLDSKGWSLGHTPKGYIFLYPLGEQKHALEFTKDSVFLHHMIASHIKVARHSIEGRNLWSVGARGIPVQKKQYDISLSRPLETKERNKHPLLLSLGEVCDALEPHKKTSLLLEARWHYWWSHFFWSVGLVFLAPALLVGPQGRQGKMLATGIGLILSLIFYLMKEWLYAISIPLAHSWPNFFLWIPSLCTAALALILFFEKKEL